MPETKLQFEIRDRIREFRRVPAAELHPRVDNLRAHPQTQRLATASMLREIGFAGAVLAWEPQPGYLELLDGHLRQDLVSGNQLVPTLILDVNEDEARLLNALYDPLGDLAVVKKDLVRDVLDQIKTDEDELQVMLLELSGSAKIEKPGASAEEEIAAANNVGPPGMELRPYEHYDYVVVLARNTMDWQALCTKLGLEMVDASPTPKIRKIGIGRCVDAKLMLERMK
jgi:hypothetical protein